MESGGTLFTTFLDQMASPSSHEVWAKHRARVRREGVCLLASTDFAAIKKKEHGKFYGWLVFATSNIKPRSRKHQFLQTFSARYHGLSRLGQKILGFFGLLLKRGQYDRLENNQVIAQRKEVRSHFLFFPVNVQLLIVSGVATSRMAATSSGWTTSPSTDSNKCRYLTCRQERSTKCCGQGPGCEEAMSRLK